MKTSNLEMDPMHGLSAEDAVDMLIADHKRVANLFAEFKRLTDDGLDADKAAVVTRICEELTVHTQLEEELFYPAVRDAIDDDDQMDEALVEHSGAKDLIRQLQSADPKDDLYDAKVTVLGEQIDHHVEEEEGSMFPKARHAGVDTGELGAAMLKRKAELQRGEPSKGSRGPDDEEDVPARPALRQAPSAEPKSRAPIVAGKKTVAKKAVKDAGKRSASKAKKRSR